MIIDVIIQILNYIFAACMPVTHIGGYAVSLLSVLFIWKYWGKINKEPVFMWLLVFFIYGMMLVPFSGEPKASLGVMTGYLTHWILPFILGYGLTGETKARNMLLVYFAVITAVAALSMLAYYGLFSKVVGGNFFLVEDGLLKAGRSHIAFAALCIFIAMTLASFALLPGRGRALKGALLAASVFYVLALALSGSRGYYIAAALVFPAAAVYWTLKNGKIKYLAILALAAVIGVGLVYKFNHGVRERIHRTGASDQNVSERLNLYKVAVEEIKARPVFGYGPGQGIKQKNFFEKLPEAQRNLDRHPALHSFYLNFAADFGLAGFAIFVIIMASILMKLAAVMGSKDGFADAAAFGLFWGLLGLLVGDCFDTILRGPGVAMELFWALGMVLRNTRERSKEISNS